MKDRLMRLCFVQYGDFAETLARRDRGEGATYRAQDYSVDWVLSRRAECDAIGVIAVGATEAYDTEREGLSLHGAPDAYARSGSARVTALLDRLAPTHIVLRTPIMGVFGWAERQGAELLPLLADSFVGEEGYGPRALRDRWRARRLARELNRETIPTVSNHNVAACADLVRIGVRKEKTIPWDWPAARVPSDYAPKRVGSAPYTLLYVGMTSRAKGVGDLVSAFTNDPWLRDNAVLDVVGDNEERTELETDARAAGVADTIRFHGKRTNDEVFERMRAADLLLVPSRHAYSEGLPGTIYEGLTVRTPIVMSDHPMFEAYLRDGEGVAFTPEADPGQLASTVRSVLSDPDRYAALSDGTAAAFERIRCPNLWHEVIEAWVMGDPDGWLAERRGAWTLPPSAVPA